MAMHLGRLAALPFAADRTAGAGLLLGPARAAALLLAPLVAAAGLRRLLSPVLAVPLAPLLCPGRGTLLWPRRRPCGGKADLDQLCLGWGLGVRRRWPAAASSA